MATQAEVLKRMDEAATNAEHATDAYYDVLTTDGEQDITLVDGTTTPNLNKRLSQMTNSVQSVSGKTGHVELEPSDIGYPTLELLDRREKEARFVVDKSGLNQQEINDTVILKTEKIDIIFDTIADVKEKSSMSSGQFIHVNGFYAVGDGGGGDFLIIQDSVTVADGVSNIRVSPELIATMYSAKNSVDIRRFGVVIRDLNTVIRDVPDSYNALQLAFDSNFNLDFPIGRFKTSKTINVARRLAVHGASIHKSVLLADFSELTTPVFYMSDDAALGDWQNFSVVGNVAKYYGEAFVMSGSIGKAKFPHKNSFRNIGVVALAGVVRFTTDNPLQGSTHAMCSENLFDNCRFTDVRYLAVNQNMQALNNWFRNCDFENVNVPDDINSTYIKDFAGGGIYWSGGSIVGKGKLYSWLYPAGGTGLFSGCLFKMSKTRFECRSGHSGALIVEGVHGNSGTSRYVSLSVSDIDVLTYGQNIDVLRYAGRLDAHFEDVRAIQSATLKIRHYPTLGQSASNSTDGSFGKVTVDRSAIQDIVETSSPYGTYNPAYVASAYYTNSQSSVANNSGSNGGDGFTKFETFADTKRFGTGVNNVSGFGKLIVSSAHSNLPLSGTRLLMLPTGLRLLKFGLFKPNYQRTTELKADVYVIKDKSAWATGTFNIATDGYLVGTYAVPANSTGLVESDFLVATATNIPSDSKTGGTGWLESRVAVVLSQSTTGFFYFEYA